MTDFQKCMRHRPVDKNVTPLKFCFANDQLALVPIDDVRPVSKTLKESYFVLLKKDSYAGFARAVPMSPSTELKNRSLSWSFAKFTMVFLLICWPMIERILFSSIFRQSALFNHEETHTYRGPLENEMVSQVFEQDGSRRIDSKSDWSQTALGHVHSHIDLLM